jgi:hypothetical protein
MFRVKQIMRQISHRFCKTLKQVMGEVVSWVHRLTWIGPVRAVLAETICIFDTLAGFNLLEERFAPMVRKLCSPSLCWQVDWTTTLHFFPIQVGFPWTLSSGSCRIIGHTAASQFITISTYACITMGRDVRPLRNDSRLVQCSAVQS